MSTEKLVLFFRFLAVASAILGMALVLDIYLPTTHTDDAIIVEHSQEFQGNYIRALGYYEYEFLVDDDFFSRTDLADALEIDLSLLFKEWREIRLSNQEFVYQERSEQYYSFIGIVAALLFLPLLSFRPRLRTWRHKKTVAVIIISEAISLYILSRVAIFYLW